MLHRPILVILSLILALQGCSAGQPAATGKKTLVFGTPFQVGSFDPDRVAEDTTWLIDRQVYGTLIQLDPNDSTKIVPQMADSWSANENNTQFTFKLKKNIVFSTGNPFTADDVKFSFDRLWNLQATPSYILTGYTSTDVVDQFTARVNISAADASFPYKLTSILAPIFDSKAAKEHGAVSDKSAPQADKAEAYFNTPISLGSGPFMYQQYVANDHFVLVRNPKYWGPAPALDKIVIQSVPESATERQLLERGSIDIAQSLDYPTAVDLSTTKGIKIAYGHTVNMIYLFNTASADISKPLSNKLVRQAVVKSIDYDGLLKFANGHAQQVPTTIPLGLVGADTAPVPHEDLTAAKQLLAQAGYPNGFEVKFSYPNFVDFNIDFSLIATKLQADLARSGIKLTLQPIDSAQFLTAFRTGNLAMGISFWTPDYADPDDYVGPMWTYLISKRIHYSNPEVNALYPQSLATSGGARVEVYRKLQAIFQQDAVLQGLMVPDFILASRDNVQGYKFLPGDSGRFDFSAISISG